MQREEAGRHIQYLKRKCFEIERDLHYERKINGVLDATVKVQHSLLTQRLLLPPFPPPLPPPSAPPHSRKQTSRAPPSPPPREDFVVPAKKPKKQQEPIPPLTCTIEDILKGNFEVLACQSKLALQHSTDERIKKLSVLHEVAKDFMSIAGEKELKKNVFAMLLDCWTTQNKVCRNIILSGESGTGKTTMASMIAKALASTGCYDTAKIKKVGRADMVAGFLGQTAIKVRELFTKQKGGVIILDEAYALTRDTKDMFCREAMDTLCDEVTKDDSQTLLICIGYEHEMNAFLEYNTGLGRRFPVRWRTNDLNTATAMQVYTTMLLKRAWTSSPVACNKVTEIFKEKKYLNGGMVSKIVDAAIKNATGRLWLESNTPWIKGSKVIVTEDVARWDNDHDDEENDVLSMYM